MGLFRHIFSRDMFHWLLQEIFLLLLFFLFVYLFFSIQILYYLLEQLQQSQIKLHYITKRKKKEKEIKKKQSTEYVSTHYNLHLT